MLWYQGAISSEIGRLWSVVYAEPVHPGVAQSGFITLEIAGISAWFLQKICLHA